MNLKFIKRIIKRFLIKEPSGFVLRIEATSYCNQQCYFCPQSRYHLKNRIMPMDMFKRIIDSIYELKIPIWAFEFTGMCEPLTDPYLFERCEYARKVTGNFVLYTNGKLLNERALKKINKVFSRVYFSLHGSTPEEYESYSGNKFEVMKEKLFLAKEILGDKLILLNYPEGKLARVLGIERYQVHPFHNWMDEEIAEKTNSSMAGCKYCPLTKLIFFRVNGSLGTCGNDWDNINDILNFDFPLCSKCYSKDHFSELLNTGRISEFVVLLKRLVNRIEEKNREVIMHG